MGIAIGVLLTVIAVAVVAWPLVRRGRAEAVTGFAPGGAPDRGEPGAEDLRQARAEIYRQVRQLDLDHAAGLVGEPEFRAQFNEFRAEAARLLMEESTRAAGIEGAEASDPAAMLEREIAEARATLSSTPGGPARRGQE